MLRPGTLLAHPSWNEAKVTYHLTDVEDSEDHASARVALGREVIVGSVAVEGVDGAHERAIIT